MSNYELDENSAIYPWQIDYIQSALMWALKAPEQDDELFHLDRIEVRYDDGEVYGVIFTGDDARFVPVKPKTPLT